MKSDRSDVVPSRQATSDTVTANVAAAATPSNGPTTTAANRTGGAGTTATTIGAAGSPSSGAGASGSAVRDSVDLSGFADLLAKARAASHSPVSTEPDTGFQRTLPFHQRSSLPGSDGSPLGNAGPIGHLFDPGTVALGMFLLVLAMHGFVLRAAARRTATADGIAEPVEAR